MDTQTHRLPRSTLAGGLAVLLGSILWWLGIEFERIWQAAYEWPAPGSEPSRRGG